MKKKNRFRYIKLLVMFFAISVYSMSATTVNSLAGLTTALSNISENLIILNSNISLTSNIPVLSRTGGDLTIDGNGYTVSMNGYNFTLLDGINNQKLTFKNFKATASSFFTYENTLNNRWNIFLDGTNNISTSFEVMFRSDDSTSSFTANPGSNNTLTGTGGKTPFGLIESYGNVTFDNSYTLIDTRVGSAFYYRDLGTSSKNRTINVINGGTVDVIGHSAIYAPDLNEGTSDNSNISLNVVGSGSKFTASTKDTTFNSGIITGRSDINLLAKDSGIINASTNVSGKDVFYGGMNPTITADNGTINLSSTGSKVVNFYDKTGTIEAKNDGIININGNTSGAVVQISRQSSGYYTINDVTSIHSSTGGNIIIKNTGTGTGVVANGDSILKVTSEDSGSKIEMNTSGNTFSSDKSGTEIVAKNSGEISFTSSGANSTNITLSDSSNNSIVSALNGGQIKVNNNGSGNAVGIAVNEKPVDLTVKGNASSLDVNIPNATGTSYGINLSTNTGQKITVDDSGKLDVDIKSAVAGTGINSTVGLTANISDQSTLTIENASNSGAGINISGGSTNTFAISGSGTTVKVENTASSNAYSAINTNGSLSLGTGSNLYTLNESSSNASINATTGITFTAPGEFNIQNNSISGRAVDSTSSTTLALNNTSIIMWDNDKAPSYVYGDQYDAWKNLTANLLDVGTTSLAVGISKSNSTVDLSQMGRLTNLVSGTPVITKSTTDITYIPGGTITYKIIVNNPDLISFVSIKDILADQKTTDINGLLISAFSSFTYTSSETGIGFTIGNTSSGNGTINDLLTMVGDSTVTYTIIATVNPKAAGNISNTATATVNGTTITAVSNNSTPAVGTVTATKTTTDVTYIPGGTVTFTLTETNTGGLSTVSVLDKLADQQTTDANGAVIPAYTSWSYSSSISGTGSASGNTATGTGDISDTLKMTGDVVVTYTITATVNPKAAGNVSNTATSGSTAVTPSSPITPAVGTVTATKTTESTSYKPGDEVIYTITVTNSGGKSLVVMNDLIANQTTTDANGKVIPAFSNWEWSATESGTGDASGYSPGVNVTDINHILSMTGDVVVTYTVKATVSLNAMGSVTNIAKLTINGLDPIDVTDPDGPISIVETEEKMSLIKTTSTNSVTSDGIAVYTISVTNNTSMVKSGFYIYDMPPLGFSYVNDSAVITFPDETKSKTSPTVGEKVVFGPYMLKEGETLKINYAMKISSTVPSGNYKNLAVAKLKGKEITNIDDATVNVSVNTFIDSATIIGKVYMDIDGDNVQDSSEATNVVITNFDTSNFISDTGTVTSYNSRGIEISKSSLKYNLSTIQVSSILNGKSLFGKDNNINSVKIKVQLTNKTIPKSYVLETKEGMVLNVNNGKIDYLKSTGIYLKGMTSQALNVKTKILEEEDKTYLEIIITNTGIQEEGIAGVRLVTPEGYTVITDEFGRYHLPDKIVEKLRGSNVVVKLDSSTLPTGTQVISENPVSKLVTGSALNVIDFAVQPKKQGVK